MYSTSGEGIRTAGKGEETAGECAIEKVHAYTYTRGGLENGSRATVLELDVWRQTAETRRIWFAKEGRASIEMRKARSGNSAAWVSRRVGYPHSCDDSDRGTSMEFDVRRRVAESRLGGGGGFQELEDRGRSTTVCGHVYLNINVTGEANFGIRARVHEEGLNTAPLLTSRSILDADWEYFFVENPGVCARFGAWGSAATEVKLL
ncbi:hypothetical protein NEOLEDRAFT_1152475 [Neolentinus lepideus HHB14362 ss-1]|uniref:Uncharacterized protein n=1 Tax=Neolentinus lepideus HHB14362 ss-1 TaxID=1314782 RepID=A0A165MRC7_9AGAM|nr:hypothetical protein NEOLEDRAFT_1152475 [Neolentinus lepideus HHB14362 ss-1]